MSRISMCRQCGDELESEEAVIEHVLSEHPGAYVCITCDESFGSLKALDLHDVVHIPRFQCDQCDRAFYAQGDLDFHLEAHTAFGFDDLRSRRPQQSEMVLLETIPQQAPGTSSVDAPTTPSTVTTWATASQSTNTPATATSPSTPSGPMTGLLTPTEVEMLKQKVQERFIQPHTKYASSSGQDAYVRADHSRSETRRFGCNRCTYFFQSADSLTDHIRASHIRFKGPIFRKHKTGTVTPSMQRYLCPPCENKEFSDLESYQQHYKMKHYDFRTGR